MKGYDAIVSLRKARKIPASVCIVDGVSPGCNEWQQHINPYDGQLYAAVQIDATETPESLDLRALVGLVVLINGERSKARTERIFAAVKSAGAKAVVATYGIFKGPFFEVELELSHHG